MKPAAHKWPPHRQESRDWSQAHRGGTRDDRMLRSIMVSLPPLIADRAIDLDSDTAADLEAATSEITKLDGTYADDLSALGTLLLRTESVASSKIEQIEANVDDYARALHGVRANSSAVAMAAATTALEAMIGTVGSRTPIRLSAITTAHAALMRDDPSESTTAGELRTVQNWIGGSDFSPRGALYIPPPPETVQGYMNDLITFANRDDMPVLLQAAIAHAQFESIHPFTDGNGRIGRALINTILRCRGTTTRVVVPLASALVARRDDYFDVLGSYRSGDLAPLLGTFIRSARIASAESRITAQRLHEIPSQWRELTGPVRRGSAAAKLLDLLPSTPILSSDDAVALIDAPRSSVFDAISRLRSAEVLRALTDRKRDQIWGARLVLDELEDLGNRIAVAVRR
ncbi:fic protein [Mycolicibacterium conceptionense]|uniref:Fic protein n=2 Tax=Mycobacteriaceae TaxID=1762 RepID=A0A1A2VGD8_9MYCO|nr:MULTISPECIES: Fic family protein [Mycolicibacterium]MCW1819734.1 Fic family protein [Mycolicibacterium senegalense]OBB04562.1 fic protein [Mycolicibacterium conceptionense]OBE93825.1 fic protein [Mycolicibacterium conceptionense]OBF15151.1 fic protein [Mycolicibacterium conceptionense]OBF34615.1 fic protein [Mycolicibacterium conceptionense]